MILFKKLADGIPSFKGKYLSRTVMTPDEYKAYEFITDNITKIEICQNNTLQNVYFPIRPVCHFLNGKTKDQVMLTVIRDTQATKVITLMARVQGLMDEMEQNDKLENATIKITPKTLNALKDFSTVVGAFMSAIQLFTLTRTNHYKIPQEPEIVVKVVNILGIVQGFSAGILIYFYYINRFGIITKAAWRDYVDENMKKKRKRDEENKNKGAQSESNESRLKVTEMSID